MNLVSFAFRNVARQRHRAWITISAMAFAGFIMIFYASLMEGIIDATERNAISMELGQFQIHVPGYRTDPDLYTLIYQDIALLQTIEGAGFIGTPRLYAFGLAAAGKASAGVRLRGVDLERESLVTEAYGHIMTGKWLDERDPFGVVIGRKLAKTLNVGVGDEVVVVSQAADGSMANDLYAVRGILKSIGEGIDANGFFLNASSFRDLMALEAGVHEIVVRWQGRETPLEQLTQNLGDLVPDLEVKNWRQLRPVVARIVDTSRYSLIIMLMITYTAIGILALNAMLMSVYERIREFGIMKALGIAPWRVFSLILLETVMQVSIASLLALAGGVPLSYYCESHPIDLSKLASASLTFAGIAIDPVWYSRVTFESVFTPVAVLFGMALFAVLYPAGKAAVIRPVQAIYHR